MRKVFDCIGLGIAPADLIMQINSFPKPGVKFDTPLFIVQGGGPIPTAMVTLSRLGFNPTIISAIGKDIFGQFVINELNNEGVDTSLLIAKKQSSTAIASGWAEIKTGRRTIGLGLDISLSASDYKLRDLPRARLIHIDGRYMPACLKLARWANKNYIPVSLDVGSMRNDVSELLPLADHFVCAEEFALSFTGASSIKKSIEKLRNNCVGTIVVTSGHKGALGFSEDSGFARQKAFEIDEVDTTGAGDAYHGGYLAGLLKNWPLTRRMKFASAVAAMNCTKLGGRTGLPSMNQALAFMKKRKDQYA